MNIKKFKDFPTKFADKWNSDTPVEINLPDFLGDDEEQEEDGEQEEFNEAINDKVITFTNSRNPRLVIKVTKSRDGRITNIDNNSSIRFPFHVGQLFNRTIEVWASNNNFLMDGKDMSPEKKIMGIKVSDIPKGHDLRYIYPNKFK